MDYFLLEDDAPVLMITRAQPRGGNIEIKKEKILHSFYCNDGRDSVKDAFPEALEVSDGTVNGNPLRTRDFMTYQTIEPYCREIVYTVCKKGSVYSYDRQGFLLRRLKIDG